MAPLKYLILVELHVFHVWLQGDVAGVKAVRPPLLVWEEKREEFRERETVREKKSTTVAQRFSLVYSFKAYKNTRVCSGQTKTQRRKQEEEKKRRRGKGGRRLPLAADARGREGWRRYVHSLYRQFHPCVITHTLLNDIHVAPLVAQRNTNSINNNKKKKRASCSSRWHHRRERQRAALFFPFYSEALYLDHLALLAALHGIDTGNVVEPVDQLLHVHHLLQRARDGAHHKCGPQNRVEGRHVLIAHPGI